MKKISILLLLVVLLSGCSQVKETVETQSSNEASNNDSFGDSFYRIIKLDINSSRDDYYNSYSQTKDFQSIGSELSVLSIPHFSTDKYYKAEGQQIKLSKIQEDLLKWKTDERKYSLQLKNDEAIEGNTGVIMVSSVYELDFYEKSGDSFKLSGMSFGIVLDPVKQDGTALGTALSDESIKEYGKKCIETFYSYLTNDEDLEKIKDIPTNIAVYQATNSAESNYNGKYILSSFCSGSLGAIEDVNYKNLIFTSSEAEKQDAVTSSEFAQFKNTLKKNATEAVGVIGYGRYRDGSLANLNIKLNVNVKTQVELEYLVAIAAEDLNGRFSAPIDITVEVHSQDGLEGFIVKERGSDAKSYLTNY